MPIAADEPGRPGRWAVIAADPGSEPLANLITAELTTTTQIELVERDEIQKVLGELSLAASGLVERDQAMQFGRISQADALVILNSPESKQPKNGQLRVRLIDTRTSIRLLDVMLPRRGVDEEVTAIAVELQSAAAVLSIPADQLRMIGVVPVVSGEAGYLLKPYCRTLTALIAAELFRRPNVVVLERSDLQRLADESKLSGIELKIRGATRLFECSVRRTPDGEGIVATCQLTMPGGGNMVSTEIQVDSLQPLEARAPLVAWTLENLDVNQQPQAVSPQQEAVTFDRRTRWARGEDAVAMAEAALALAPTKKRFQTAVAYSAKLAYDRQIAKQYSDALIAYRQWARLRLKYLDQYKHKFQERQVVPIYYAFASPIAAETQQEQQWLAECSDLLQQILRKQLQDVAGDPLAQLDTKLQLVNVDLRWKPSTPGVTRLGQLLKQAFQLREPAGVPRDLRDPYFNEMIRCLMVGIQRVHEDTLAGSGHLHAQDFDRWANGLRNLDESFVDAAILRAQTTERGVGGEQAAGQLLKHLHELPLVDTKYVDLPLRRAALSRISDQHLFAYFQKMLDRCEAHDDPREVLVLGRELGGLLKRLPALQSTSVARRMIGLLKLDHPANTMFTTTPMLAALSRFVPREESPFQPLPEFTLDDAAGPWGEYRTRAIRLGGPRRRLQSLAVDHAASADQSNIYLAWSNADGTTSIERVGLSGKPAEIFAENIGGFPKYGRMRMAVGGDSVYLTGSAPGFTMVTRDAVRNWTEADGAASNKIRDIVWLRDRLFIAYDQAFGSFDPRSKEFQLHASSTSVTPRNRLDGRGGFQIRKLLAAHDAIWLAIHDRTKTGNRTGIWRSQPWQDRYEKITSYGADISASDGGILVHSTTDPRLSWIDAQSLSVTELPEFQHASGPNRYDQASFVNPNARSYELPYPTPRPHLIKIGPHLIGGNCKLFTAEGKSHALAGMPSWMHWLHLQRLGNGFLTHYETSRRTLWYVEPK